MNRRVPFFVAVVGALLIGSATTGTTHASWTDQAPLPVTQVSSGALAFSASAPAGVSVRRSAGESGTATITVADTSAGKNLKQRITASVASTPAGVTASVATTCGGTVSYVDTTPGTGNQTFCVRVTSSTTAVSGTVVVNLAGTQRPTGWSTPVLTRSVPVTVASDPLVLSCGGSQNPAPRYRLTWDDVDADGYVVLRSSSANGPWDAVHVTTWSQYVEDEWTSGQRSYFRVVAYVDRAPVQASNVLSVRRTGTYSFSCGAP